MEPIANICPIRDRRYEEIPVDQIRSSTLAIETASSSK